MGRSGFQFECCKRKEKEKNKLSGYVTMTGEGKCGGRKQHSENNPELVKRVKMMRRRNWRTKKQMPYREISGILFDEGIVNQPGNKFNPKSIMNMVKQ